MKTIKGHLVDYVTGGSPADKAGIKAGWELLRIDNREIEDIIDYKIMESDSSLRLLVKTDRGSLRRITIHKPAAAALGLRFDPPTMDRLQRCRNRCIFCFIDQNPTGLRKPLYVKDDDYRLSFLYGNFITLNRMTDKEVERVKKLQLSPLYVSVHTTNPDLRKIMFASSEAGRGLRNLEKLVSAGIRVHAQVVLCPGYNTGKELERTITDLARQGKEVLSLALVPVGLTAHRSGLPALERFSQKAAQELIKWITEMQDRFLAQRGSRFVFLADEFYNLAGLPLPEEFEYEDYPQLENGVGLARQFLEELKDVEAVSPAKLPRNFSAALASGLAARLQVTGLAESLGKIENLDINPVFIKNRFFGEEVTVSGLLTGSDLLSGLEGKKLGDVVFIPEILLKENSALFLDNMTLSDLEKSLQVPVRTVKGPLDLLDQIRNMAGCRQAIPKRGPNS